MTKQFLRSFCRERSNEDVGDCSPWVSNPRPAATFVNYVYTIKLHNNLGS